MTAWAIELAPSSPTQAARAINQPFLIEATSSTVLTDFRSLTLSSHTQTDSASYFISAVNLLSHICGLYVQAKMTPSRRFFRVAPGRWQALPEKGLVPNP